jgi:hypothetical protein
MDSREIRVKFRLEGYSNLAASTTYLHGSGNSLACHRDWTEAHMRTVRGLARGFAALGSAITALMQGSNTPRLASTAICGLMLLARLASQGDCTCSGRLSDPKTFEASCSIPIVGDWEIVNEGCNTIEAPEECERVFDYGVRGSACNDLDWTPEFTPLGDRYRLMCWSQRGVPPCSKLVRWLRVVFCTQSQCIGRQLSISPMHNLNNHSGSSIDINVPKSERNLQRANEQDDYKIGFTRTVLLYARPVPTIKLSDEERVRYTARYYQLLHRELQNQQAQWIAMWEEVTLSILGQFKDWQNWTGNRWRGHWEELPTDIRQKLALLLQANNAPIDYQKIQCELIIIPYIGFVQDDGNFRYSEWFTLID